MPANKDNGIPGKPFLLALPAPARRALENAGIITLERLSEYSSAQLLALHGLGPSSIPKLQRALQAEGLSLKSD